MAHFAEHREYSRSPIHARTEIRLGNGIVVEGDAVDVSLRGLLFTTENRLPVGKPVQVALIVERPFPPQRINADGQVARLHSEGVVVKFTDMDPDNSHHLSEAIRSEKSSAAPYAVPRRKN